MNKDYPKNLPESELEQIINIRAKSLSLSCEQTRKGFRRWLSWLKRKPLNKLKNPLKRLSKQRKRKRADKTGSGS